MECIKARTLMWCMRTQTTVLCVKLDGDGDGDGDGGGGGGGNDARAIDIRRRPHDETVAGFMI